MKDWVVSLGVWAFTVFWLFPVSLLVGLVSIQNISVFWPGLVSYVEIFLFIAYRYCAESLSRQARVGGRSHSVVLAYPSRRFTRSSHPSYTLTDRQEGAHYHDTIRYARQDHD